MTVLDIVLPGLVVTAASLVAGMAGFGFGLITMGILPWFVGLRNASILATLFATGILVAGLVPLRKHVRLRRVAPLLAGLAVGVPLGVYLLVSLDEAILKRALGAALLLYLGVDLVVLRRLTVRIAPCWGVLAGLVGGALGGAFSTSGPPGLIYITSQRWNKEETKATVLVYLIASTFYKLPFVAAGGLITPEVLVSFALWVVPAAIGTAAGMRLFRRLSGPAFGVVLRITLAATGILLLTVG